MNSSIMEIDEVKQVPLTYMRLWQNDYHLAFMTYAEKRLGAFFEAAGEVPPKLSESAEAFREALREEDEWYLVSQKSRQTPLIAEADRRRDELLRQVKAMVAAMSRMDAMPDRQRAALSLVPDMRRYRLSARVPYETQTTALTQWHQDYAADPEQVEAARLLGIADVIEEMMALTEEVTDLIDERMGERGHKADIDLGAARRRTDAAFRRMVLVLNAFAVVDDDPHRYDDLIVGIAADQQYFRRLFEDRRRTSRRVSVRSDLVGNRRYNVCNRWTWARLAADNSSDLVVADGRVCSAHRKARKAGGLVVALDGLPVSPADEARPGLDYALVPADSAAAL